ncbi:hypothetical protein OQZ33_00460 [Pedobacter sp. MC2016-05]|uniref:hypothetical protein n=1 Tax=Pedobacter sp. MC2016-05 TaxID=2994474 RepID=UPI0022474701|nr:hypothetical protein [Pedobacter sp. MC2016-05]MCX2472790.1 hypothetical protein [Pedobacter sp. MC2016-05]
MESSHLNLHEPHTETNLLSTEDLPYLYQSDSHNFGFDKRGFYLDSKGNQYRYSIPEEDYFSIIKEEEYNSNTPSNEESMDEPHIKTDVVYYDTIKPSELFNKLELCEVTKSDLRFELTSEVIKDLLSAPIVESESFIMDSGWRTKSVLVYLAELDVYKRILLVSSGNTNKLNTSIFTDGLLKTLTP